jgi:hypothetical protein
MSFEPLGAITRIMALSSNHTSFATERQPQFAASSLALLDAFFALAFFLSLASFASRRGSFPFARLMVWPFAPRRADKVRFMVSSAVEFSA